MSDTQHRSSIYALGESRLPRFILTSPRSRAALAIVLIVASLALALAYLSGSLGKDRLTSSGVLDAVTSDAPHPFPAGFRRAHGKGMCFQGTFEPSKQARMLSSAALFSDQSTPVLGRFSLGSGDPRVADNSTRSLSISLLLKEANGSEWRMALLNDPFFPTATVEGLLAMGAAFAPDPATMEPSQERIESFYQSYPEARKYIDWTSKAPWGSSFAVTQFNSINTFVFINAQGERRFVRWALRPHTPFTTWPESERESAAADALFVEVRNRIEKEPVRWDLVVAVAAQEDPVNDPSQPWPENRESVVAGVISIKSVSEQADGACRDLNFDPTIVPEGIEISEDPVLRARSGVYAKSFNLRENEIGLQSLDAGGTHQ